MPKFRKRPVVIDAFRWEGFAIGLTNGGGTYPPTLDAATPSSLRLEIPKWMPPVSRVITDEKWPSKVPTGHIWRDGDDLWIGTLEGPHLATPGDWIVCGVQGELYPVKDNIFAATYEAIE